MATDEFDPMYGDALPMGTRIGAVVLGGAIGQGAEGIVYLAEHERLGRVVVKEFWPKQIASRSASGGVKESQPGWQEALRDGRNAFTRTGQRLCELEPHPNIVQAYELIENETTSYLVMQHAQGVALASLLQSGTPLEPAQVLALADALTSAAAHLHANQLIHRDIAPDNVLVGADLAKAVLIDLNAAKDEVQQASQSVHGLVKAGYSPFEQYSASTSRLDKRSDIYGITAVLIHAVTGQRPLDAVRRMELGSDASDPLAGMTLGRYSPDFLAALRHGFALRAADRPETVEAWRQELGLDVPVGQTGVSPLPPPAQLHPEPPRKKNRSLVLAGLAAATFFSGWVIYHQWSGSSDGADVFASGAASEGVSQAALADASDAAKPPALRSGAVAATGVPGQPSGSSRQAPLVANSSPASANSSSCHEELVDVQTTELVPEQVAVSRPRTKEVSVPTKVEQVYYDDWAPRANYDRARACEAHSLQRSDLLAEFASRCSGGRIGPQYGFCKGNHGDSDSYIGYIQGSCIMTVPDTPVIEQTTRMVERPVTRQKRQTVCN